MTSRRPRFRSTPAALAGALLIGIGGCQSATEPTPDPAPAPLVLNLSFSDTTWRPDSVAWSRGGTAGGPTTVRFEGSRGTVTFPTSDIGTDTIDVDLARLGLRIHSLKAWTTTPPNLTAIPTTDTTGKRILGQFLTTAGTSPSASDLLRHLGAGVATGTIDSAARTRLKTAWSTWQIDSAALLDVVRSGRTLEDTRRTWSVALAAEKQLEVLQRWQASGIIGAAELDRLVGSPSSPDGSMDLLGLPSTLELREDSTASLRLRVLCPAESTCTLSRQLGDSSLLAATLVREGDSARLLLAPAPDRHGSTSLSLEISSGSRSSKITIPVRIQAINDAPMVVARSPLGAAASGRTRLVAWLESARPGPSDETNQKLSFSLVADSAASLLSDAPFVDDSGVLVVVGKGISGTVRIRLTARDDGDSTLPHRNTSDPTWLRIRMESPPEIRAPSTAFGREDTRLALDTIRVGDLESPPEDLDLTWTVLDSALLPLSGLRVRTVPGGFFLDALPAPDRHGKTRIAFRVRDGAGLEAFDTTEIEILPVNDSPTIAAAPGLPDTIVIPCTSSDTTLPKLFGDIVWEPGTSNQSGTWAISLVDTAQAKYFHVLAKNGIQVLENGGVRMQIKIDTTMLVRLLVTATDDGGTENGGWNTGRRTILVKYTNTVKDVDGNVYTYRRMPDGRVWMTSNLYTRPKNGDTAYQCAGNSLWSPDGDGKHLTADCKTRGALYNWGTAMGQPMGCDTSMTCYQAIPRPARGLCPEGWHVAEREEWSALMVATAPAPAGTNTTVDSTYNLRSATSDWGMTYTPPWNPYPGSGMYGMFLVPTDQPFHCSDKYADLKNAVNFWLPHWSSAIINPIPGGITFTVANKVATSDGMCGNPVPTYETASIRCLKDSK